MSALVEPGTITGEVSEIRLVVAKRKHRSMVLILSCSYKQC